MFRSCYYRRINPANGALSLWEPKDKRLIRNDLQRLCVKKGNNRYKEIRSSGYQVRLMPRFLKTATLVLQLLVLVYGIPAALAQVHQDHACGNSTVGDAWGPEFAARAQAFLGELQSAVEGNNKAKFASMVQYPVRVLNGKRNDKIATPSQLAKEYPQIVTPTVRKAILDQSAACLFGNGQGVMIGSGEIWFAQQSNGKLKIITINAEAPR